MHELTILIQDHLDWTLKIEDYRKVDSIVNAFLTKKAEELAENAHIALGSKSSRRIQIGQILGLEAKEEPELMDDMTNCVLPLNEPIILQRQNGGRIGYKYANRTEPDPAKKKTLAEVLCEARVEGNWKWIPLKDEQYEAMAKAALSFVREHIDSCQQYPGYKHLIDRDELLRKLAQSEKEAV